MKRFIMLALVLTFITGTAFSNINESVNQKVLTSFTKKFSKAEEVQWELKKDFYKATFKLQGQVMFAYFNSDGEQIALSRNISVYQLPLNLSRDLQAGYDEYYLAQLFEVASNNETAYYATVETGTHITTLKADRANGWSIYKKEKKQD